jgi:site-specific recombinase XerD
MSPLRQRMLEDMRIRNFSPHTQKQYIIYVVAFAKHFGKSPEQLGLEQIRSYQLFLLEQKRVCPATLNLAVSALRFLYGVSLQQDWDIQMIPYAKKLKKLPVVLSQEEVLRFLQVVRDMKYRTVLMTTYAAGLRVSDVTQLKVKGQRHRQRAYVYSNRAGQRSQGPLCNALSEVASSLTPVLENLQTRRLAFRRSSKRSSSHINRTNSMQESSPRGRHQERSHSTYLEALCRVPDYAE